MKDYSYNNDMNKIEKARITAHRNRDIKVKDEMDRFLSIPLKDLLNYFMSYSLTNKTIQFIKPFHFKYHSYTKLLKNRVFTELKGSNFNNILYDYYFGKNNNCRECNKKTNFVSLSKGYKSFCNGKVCSNKWISKNKDNDLWKSNFKKTVEKRDKGIISETLKEAALEMKLNGTEQLRITKIRASKEASGLWCKRDDKPYFEQYLTIVNSLTEKNYRKYKNIINPDNLNRTRADIDKNGFHLDHIISKKYGFDNGILPFVIASIKNLQMLTISENSTKQAVIDSSLLNDIVFSA